jgi:hypothetical protein
MAKKFKTLYLKVPVDTIRPIERIADSQHRTTSAQVVMILELWLSLNPEKPEPIGGSNVSRTTLE